MHGKGLLILHSGDYYEGRFSNDKMNGQGVYNYVNNDVYNGNFIDNIRHSDKASFYSSFNKITYLVPFV